MDTGTRVQGQPRCSVCGGQAVFLDRYSKSHLCSAHFIDGVERRVAEKISAGG